VRVIGTHIIQRSKNILGSYPPLSKNLTNDLLGNFIREPSFLAREYILMKEIISKEYSEQENLRPRSLLKQKTRQTKLALALFVI
jgi:hypothetical protein